MNASGEALNCKAMITDIGIIPIIVHQPIRFTCSASKTAGIRKIKGRWHLTQAGCRNVLVIERESQQGLGSTGKSMGGVRAQFATAVNIRMSLYSIPIFAAFEEITGHPSEYKSHGYLFVATAPQHVE